MYKTHWRQNLYCFQVFGADSSQEEVYVATTKHLVSKYLLQFHRAGTLGTFYSIHKTSHRSSKVDNVLNGFNATVFAYGATGFLFFTGQHVFFFLWGNRFSSFLRSNRFSFFTGQHAFFLLGNRFFRGQQVAFNLSPQDMRRNQFPMLEPMIGDCFLCRRWRENLHHGRTTGQQPHFL